MTLKQQYQTIGIDLKRIAHILITNGSNDKKEYFLNEVREIFREISGQNLPEKIKKIFRLFNLEEVLRSPINCQADIFLTWGSIMSLRAASL